MGNSGTVPQRKDEMTTSFTTGSSDVRRGAAVTALIGVGLLHAFLAPEYIQETLYIGLLFAVSLPLTLGVAAWLAARDDRRAWAAGALLSAGMIVGFLVSRTVGLPGFDETGSFAKWAEGFPSLAAEVAFLGLAARGLLSRGSATGRPGLTVDATTVHRQPSTR